MQKKLAVLGRIAKIFNTAEITWAVGASLMLYLCGVTDKAHDIDLMIADQDALRAKAALEQIGTLLPSSPNRQYRSAHFYELVVDGVDVDLMAGFVIVKDNVEYACPLTPDTVDRCVLVCGQRVFLQSMQTWRRYYELMGREQKVRLIDEACGRA